MSVQVFRKRPVEVQAMRWDGSAAGASLIIDWILDGDSTARWHGPVATLRSPTGVVLAPMIPSHIAIDTLEGTILASVGDWIIRGVKGEFYPCKPDIFAATYDAVLPGVDGGAA